MSSNGLIRGTNSDAFWSDANLNQRAKPATAFDLAPGPNEDVTKIMAGSPALQAAPLRLADIEFDEGGRSADGEDADYLYESPDLNAPAGYYAPPAAPSADDDRLSRLEANLERLTNLLLGDK